MEQIDALRADMGIVMRFAEKIAMDDPEREAFDRIQSALPALLDAVERLNRGEWHAYVFNGHGGCDYPGEDIFLTKAEADAELARRMGT